MATIHILHKNIVKTVGEGPVWLDDSNEVGFIDIFESKMIRVHGDTNNIREVTVPNVDCLSLGHPTTLKDRFIGLCGHDIIAFDWDSPANFKVLASVDHGIDTRLNDGTADRSGRFWAGTMGNETAPGVVPHGLGSLFVLEVDESTSLPKPVKKANTEPVDLANGIDWNIENNRMFFIDSTRKAIYVFNYDEKTGDLSNQKVSIDFTNCGAQIDIGLPDGCTMDADNKLWVACYFGSCVCRFDVETGKLIERHALNSKGITSVVFGGPHLNQLYVTSADRGYENGGSLYRIDGLNARGMLTNRVSAPKI